MQELLIILLFLLGLLIIIKSADFLIEASIFFSLMTGISHVIIGITLVSIATALPEMIVSFLAIIKGAHHLAVGNVLGSMICNIALVLGLMITIAPQRVDTSNFKHKAYMLIYLNFFLLLICINAWINIWESIILIIFCFIFFYTNFKDAQSMLKNKVQTERPLFTTKDILKTFFKFIIGAGGVFIGASLLVKNSTLLADILGVGEDVFGLTIVAFGTSLPELITSLSALKRNSLELAFGNIIGANIINITLLFGAGGMLSSRGGLSIPKTSVFVTIPILIFMNILLLLPLIKTQNTYRKQGLALLVSYVIYLLITLST